MMGPNESMFINTVADHAVSVLVDVGILTLVSASDALKQNDSVWCRCQLDVLCSFCIDIEAFWVNRYDQESV